MCSNLNLNNSELEHKQTHTYRCVYLKTEHITLHAQTQHYLFYSFQLPFPPVWTVPWNFAPLWSKRPSAGWLHKSNGYLLTTSWASRSDVLLRHVSVTHASVLLFMSRCPQQLHNDKVITRIILAPKLHVLLRPLHAPLPCEFVWSNAVILIFLTLGLPLPFPLPLFFLFLFVVIIRAVIGCVREPFL